MKTVIKAPDPNLIADEIDPLLREIWSLGFTSVIESPIDDMINLINDTKVVSIPISDWRMVVGSLRFKKYQLLNGREHSFVSSSDGSLERFLTFIKKWNTTLNLSRLF